MERILIVLAKSPVPGRVKTRLCPPATPRQAADLAAAALADTLVAARQVWAEGRQAAPRLRGCGHSAGYGIASYKPIVQIDDVPSAIGRFHPVDVGVLGTHRR